MSNEELDLAVDLHLWRAGRPDEWTMDRFIRKAAQQAEEIASLKQQVEKLEMRVAEETEFGDRYLGDVYELEAKIESLEQQLKAHEDGARKWLDEGVYLDQPDDHIEDKIRGRALKECAESILKPITPLNNIKQ